MGSCASKDGGAQPAPAAAPAATPAPSKKEDPVAAGGDQKYAEELKKLNNVFSQVAFKEATKGDKTAYASISVVEKSIEVAVVSAAGDVYCATFTEADLTTKRQSSQWPQFFGLLNKGMKKATCKESGDTVVLSIAGDKPPTSFALKSAGKDQAVLHRVMLAPLVNTYHKYKSGDDSKNTKIEIECNAKRAAFTENEQKISALEQEVEPLTKNARHAQDDARAAKEQCDGVRKRIRKLKNAGSTGTDHLFPKDPTTYVLHLPHSKENVPTPIPCSYNAMVAIQEKYGAEKTTAPALVNDNANHEEIGKLLAKIDDWDFDVFALQKATGDGALFMTAYCLLHKYGLVKHFGLDETVLVNFLQAVESGYHPNPYHNATHAADVLQVTHFIIECGGLKSTINMTQNDCLAALLAAAIHDYDHPGFNNNFHIRTSAYLAILYNDRSVLENHHLYQIFDLVKDPKYNIFAGMTWETSKDIRDTILEMVLSTDMGLHAKIYQTFRRRISSDTNFATKDDQRLMLSIAIKMADISNCCRPPALYKAWAQNIASEFYHQGDTEARLGFTISPFMDRRKDKTDFPKGQISFMNYIVSPLFEAAAGVLTKLKFTLDHAKANKANWLSPS
eukprot:NODE_179_length_2098_cov_281.555393_g142_i0.p1 GENE.NODE_179_length_2098_cov_281.555393_g142_i0~~NODE_179_length_2098_cov_281.555393_g142_i0.p1  ORF type:complete len:619 (+),score=135.79 NODE_179_length_2098_cov_281.555393_g142_i0:58-1914(+)